MNFTKKDKIEIFENSISWIVVLAMFIYGGAKLIQFDGAAEIDKTVSEMTGMELMWAFYGYSKSFAITLGIFELIGGILILIKRTRIIGCLFTSTILVNVIFQDIYFGVHLGALKAAILYQLLILIILWLNKEKLIKSIKTLWTSEKTGQTKSKYFVKILIAFGIFVGLRILEYFITIKW
ncbi:DoxX family protein [Croceivirga radicis]|uniref:DoxX family protein n=1 Tax=Croceivirga radicis TaxID=1929488 RepID=UPI000255B4DF|nr:DoxX family protein [Croceivirga radicis]